MPPVWTTPVKPGTGGPFAADHTRSRSAPYRAHTATPSNTLTSDTYHRDPAEVAEWQTRRSQKPLGKNARVGSNPTFGTITCINVTHNE